jgi:hypothetical protein
MNWIRTAPDLLESQPFFILRSGPRYILGQHIHRKREDGYGYDKCLGGFDSADEAKSAAKEVESGNP